MSDHQLIAQLTSLHLWSSKEEYRKAYVGAELVHRIVRSPICEAFCGLLGVNHSASSPNPLTHAMLVISVAESHRERGASVPHGVEPQARGDRGFGPCSHPN